MPAVTQYAQRLVTLPVIRQIRRNHALEHAAIHILSSRVRGLQMAGRSDAKGFVLIGEAETRAVERAVNDALHRLQRGERGLAIHPNCGTNLVTAGAMTSAAALIGHRISRNDSTANRFSLLMTLMMTTLVISQPVGTWLQRHVTTDGDPADLRVVEVTRHESNMFGLRVVVHRVNTRSS